MGNHAGWTEIINLGCWFLKRTAVDLLKHNKKIQQKQFSQTDIECVCKFTQIVTVHWEMLSCHYILKYSPGRDKLHGWLQRKFFIIFGSEYVKDKKVLYFNVSRQNCLNF